MAQRINPTVKRLSINKGWDSKWFDFSKYPQFLEEDDLIRKTLQPILKKANFKVVFIERLNPRSKYYYELLPIRKTIYRVNEKR